MRTISVRSPRVLGSQASPASIPRAIAATRRSTPRAIAGASTACASCEGAALSGLPRLLRRPDDLPDRDLDALGGPSLADPVAHELAAPAGTHQPAALGPILLLAIPSGAIADRVVKRRLLMATQAAQACTALAVA